MRSEVIQTCGLVNISFGIRISMVWSKSSKYCSKNRHFLEVWFQAHTIHSNKRSSTMPGLEFNYFSYLQKFASSLKSNSQNWIWTCIFFFNLKINKYLLLFEIYCLMESIRSNDCWSYYWHLSIYKL